MNTADPGDAYPCRAYGGTAMVDGTARTITLIVVDDHPVVRDGLRGMFESAPGFQVLGEAADGVEGVDLAARLDPDVVLMDLRMPGGGGVAAITELTARGARSRVHGLSLIHI